MEINSQPKMLSKKLLPASMECAVCTKFGDYVCERCGETYCSKFCQLSDWREHRKFCMPVPRLMQRAELHSNAFSASRMLMEPGFDAPDAIGSVSEHSVQSDAVHLTREQITKLTGTLKELQIETKAQKVDIKSNLPEIEEVLRTPSATPAKTVQQEHKSPKVDQIDENANHVARSEVKQPELPKRHVVLSPPPKKQQNFYPSVKSIEAQMRVVIVHVEDSQTIFVIPSDKLGNWKKFNQAMNQHATVAERLKNPPEAGHIVLAKPKIGDSYSRGLVLKIRTQDEIAKVEFMEYGFIDVVKFTDMRCLTEEMVNATRLVNKVSIRGAPNETENAHEIVRFLTSLQENGSELIIKNLELIEKTQVCVHFNAILVDAEKFVSINDQIKQLVAVDTPPPNVEMEDITEPQDLSAQKKNEIKYVGFSGTNLELYILDNSFLQIGCFSAIQAKDMALLGKNDVFINDNAKEIESALPFHPQNEETCLAKSADDGRWYRAYSQGKIDDNTYNLLYLDYGNMEAVPIDRIREMREEFFFPSITLHCFIDGLNQNQLRKEAVNRLHKLVPTYTKMTFDEVTFNGEDALCKSKEILTVLKNESLI